MHELGIALSLIDTLEQEMDRHPFEQVVAVNIRIGVLTGLVPEALTFSWSLAVEKSRFCDAALHIELQEATGYCPTCRAEQTIANLQSFRCPICATPIAKVTGGRALEIRSVEVVDSRPD